MALGHLVGLLSQPVLKKNKRRIGVRNKHKERRRRVGGKERKKRKGGTINASGDVAMDTA